MAVEDLLQSTPVPAELLMDTGSWVDAKDIEHFIVLAQFEFSKTNGPKADLAKEVGHHSQDLLAWGVLDGVLRMMERPEDILLQPDRFLSYFLTGTELVKDLNTGSDVISFETGFSNEEYPYSTAYLSAVFESLPLYRGQHRAFVEWKNTHVEIFLRPEKQSSMVTAIIKENGLQSDQVDKVLEDLRRREVVLNHWIEGISGKMTDPLICMQDGLVRMADYYNRAQQLVILLMGQNRLTPQVQEAMKRVDWDHVQREFPKVFRNLCDNVQEMKEFSKEVNTMKGSEPCQESPAVSQTFGPEKS